MVSKENITCLNCKNRSELFNLMTDKEFEQIEKTRFVVTYKPGEIIYKQGTKTTQVVSITSGLAKAYIEGVNGKDYILELIRPTTMISGPGTYVDYMHYFSLKAIEETRCCFFDIEVFKKIVYKNPKLSNFLIELISKRSIHYFKKFASLTQKQVNGRIAETLLHLHDNVYKSNPIQLTISRQDIADMTGMTKDTAVRVLKDFTQENIISCDNESIQINDLAKLKKISQIG